MQKLFNKYIIPTSKIYQECLIFIGYLVFIIIPLIILLILRLLKMEETEKYLDYSLDLLFKLTAVVGLINLIYPVYLMKLINFPVKKWALKTVKCPECNNNISRCEYGFSNKSLASLIVGCDVCKKVYFLETGFWDRILKFNLKKINWLGESSEKIFEKLYFEKNYKVPLVVWFASLPFMFFSVIFLLILLSLIIYLSFSFLKINTLYFIKNNVFIVILSLISMWFLLPMLNKIIKFHKIESIVLEKWILNNVKCPECGGRFQTCDKYIKNKIHSDYKLYCEHCNKNRLLGFRGYDTRLIFLE